MRLQRQGLRPRHPHGETRDSPATPGSSGLSGLRERAKGILLAIAGTPFAAVALIHCTKPASEPSTALDAGAVEASAPESVASASAPPAHSSSAVASAASAASESAVASASSPAAPSAKPVTRADCAALAQAHKSFLDAHQSCTSDADCEETGASCGLVGVCGVAINKAYMSGLKARDAAYSKPNCWVVLAAPCPTCPPPGAPKCVSGKCALVK